MHVERKEPHKSTYFNAYAVEFIVCRYLTATRGGKLIITFPGHYTYRRDMNDNGKRKKKQRSAIVARKKRTNPGNNRYSLIATKRYANMARNIRLKMLRKNVFHFNG